MSLLVQSSVSASPGLQSSALPWPVAHRPVVVTSPVGQSVVGRSPLARAVTPRLRPWPVHWRRLPPCCWSVPADPTPDLGERGSATVLVLVAVVLLATATLGGVVLGALATLERRVESAADLAALAGAAALQGGADGCGAAGDVAARNRASLGTCAVHRDVLEVRAVRVVHLPVVGRVTLAARARAGPSGLSS